MSDSYFIGKGYTSQIIYWHFEEKTRSNQWSPRFVKQGVLCPVLFWINGERFNSELDAYWRKTTPSAN